MSNAPDYSIFWKEASRNILSQISKEEWNMYFGEIFKFDSGNTEKMVFAVPTIFYKFQIEQRYSKIIKNAIQELTGVNTAIEIIVKKIEPKEEIKEIPAEKIQEIKIEKKPAPEVKNKTSIENTTKLNEKYTFDTFVIGENNAFAANAGMAIAKDPGNTYNPLLIYGGVGLGKTHLLQSIGNAALTYEAGLKIVYVTAEQFIDEFIKSIRNKDPYTFKNKYRKADMLLIDDIHFLQNKEGTQEELFHTFNALYDNGKQIIFTCDRPVSELKNLTDRLRNRFTRGLNIDLQPPKFETRVAILKEKVTKENVIISEDVIRIICENISSNIRDLESALTRLVAYAKLVNKEVTEDIAREQLGDFFTTPKQQNLTIDTIISVTAEYFGLTRAELKGKKRTKHIAKARQIAIFIAREMTENSTTEIAIEFGGRDHTTVLHSCDRIKTLRLNDGTIEPTINELKRLITEKIS